MRQLKTFCAVLALSITPPVLADTLTSDEKLACEAILCLSSSTRPGECRPSLDRYFGIKHRKFNDTVNARIDFLNLCPASNEPNMPSLVNAIAHGAGRCDAAYLNRFNTETYTKKVCSQSKYSSYSSEDNRTCTTQKVTVISDKKPYYCTAYNHHEFTNFNTRYLGEKFKGGRWYDAQDYDKAKAEYDKQLASQEAGKAVSKNKFRSRSNNGTVEFIKPQKPYFSFGSDR